MVEFSFWPALLAGFVGSVGITALMKIANNAGMTDMPGMPLVLGSMFTDEPRAAKGIGMFVHVGVIGSLVFGTVYAALFTAFDTSSWLAGVAIGAVHGVVTAVVMSGMGLMHPKMTPASAVSGTVDVSGERIQIAEPGALATNYGGRTPVGILVGHLVYGVIVALIYGAIV